MNSDRFQSIVGRYPQLRLGIVGDFCLDRYLEIDPARQEISIETGLPVHNVVRVRSQPGGAGTILNNLVALGVGSVHVVGVAGEEGEGWELRRALTAKPGVHLDRFLQSPERCTFTYTKPLLMHPGQPPEELNRLDLKNWSTLSATIERQLELTLESLADEVDALILLEQVDRANTGVLTDHLLGVLGSIAKRLPSLLILADSRRGLSHFPPVTFKMNAAELARLLARDRAPGLDEIRSQAVALARRNQQRVFVTLAEQGILGAEPDGPVVHLPALPLRGETDIVGAGDAVTANLTAALAGGADLTEALEMANTAASIVIHQLGTTGTASVPQIRELLKHS